MTLAQDLPEADEPPTLADVGLAWKRAPSLYDMARFYSIRARGLGIRRGEAIVDCIPDRKGKLACVVVEEYPSETLFGKSALNVMRPVTVETVDGGSPEGRTFRFSLKFGFWPPSLLPDYVQLDSYGLRWLRMPHVA